MSQLNSRQEFEANLIAKAWQDESFKQELLTNPKAIYAHETGNELPAGIEIEVIEEIPGTIKMVLPRKVDPVTTNDELSEAALEAVAGGVIDIKITVVW